MCTLTDTDYFINRAKAVHGDRYDYSYAEYFGWNKKVKNIRCLDHGFFDIIPGSHYKGRGCRKCGAKNGADKIRRTTDQYISECINYHGTKYDYSRTEYIDSRANVTIGCPIHGWFQQKAQSHLKHGCAKCANELSGRIVSESTFLRRNEDFFSKAIKEHDGFYDYSITSFKTLHDKIKIICPSHGEFETYPQTHLKGGGCMGCWNERRGKKRKISQSEFISRAASVHGNRYDYSESEYKGKNSSITIICRVHGKFNTTPETHWSGSNCNKCARISAGRKRRSSTNEFIQKANEVHNCAYDYSRVKYVLATSPVTIICKKHGAFIKTPDQHLQGQGCYSCNRSLGENLIATTLDRIQIRYDQQKRFAQCKNERMLPFDFYIPSMNVCIEYHGLQHFQTAHNDFFGGEKALKARQKRDQIKRDYCQKNGIPLLEIRYDDPDPEATLREFLSQHSGRKFVDPQLKLFPV